MPSVCPTRERRLSVRPTRTAFRLACPALSATRGPSAGGPAAPLSACSGLPWPRLALHAECRGGNRPWSLTSLVRTVPGTWPVALKGAERHGAAGRAWGRLGQWASLASCGSFPRNPASWPRHDGMRRPVCNSESLWSSCAWAALPSSCPLFVPGRPVCSRPPHSLVLNSFLHPLPPPEFFFRNGKREFR